METTKFTLVSNAVAALLILAFSVFLLPYLHYLPLCVIAAVALTSFHGLFCDVGQIRRLWNLSKADFLIWLSSFFLALFSMDDFSLSFFLAVGIALLTIVHRVQKPTWNTMVRLTEGYFGEENRYEGDGSDSILKVFRFEGPLVFANAERFYANVQEIAHTIKGQLGLGIGTRTASLRSQAGGKDMMSVRTSLLIGNDPLLGTGAADSSLIKVLVLDFAAIPALDTVAIATLAQLYFELQEESIRVFFACVNASCRDQLELGGFFERVGRTVLFPTLNDAFSAARGLILPIHMSVSLNGCRDVIALSTATSRHEELGGGGGGGQEGGETVVVPPTPPANQLQPQPALV